MNAPSTVRPLPRLSHAATELLHEIEVVDEEGVRRAIAIPHERPLTIYVDRREIVTLMTLGQCPEWMVLGYLLNQRLVRDAREVASVQVAWDVAAAAVVTHHGAQGLAERTAHRVVTTGCGQGTMYQQAEDELAHLQLPLAADGSLGTDELADMLFAAKAHDSVYRRAGSVHGCAAFERGRLLMYIEDVGRHNAMDALAGWMAMQGVDGLGKAIYTTGRLTSEMVTKAALMGIAIIVSRNGITAKGHTLAKDLGMTLIGRASGRRFLCYTGHERLSRRPRQARTADAVEARDHPEHRGAI
jgi:FdhD protein